LDFVDFPYLINFNKFIQRLRKTKPVYMHGLYPSSHDICSKTFVEDLDIKYINKLIEVVDMKGISMHFEGPDYDTSKEELIKTISHNINYLREAFTGSEFFSIENVDLGRRPYANDANVISEIIYQSNADFLLDISHAYIASNRLGIDAKEYIKKLPLNKIYEIHINGWAEKDGDIMAHIKITEPAYELLEYVLQLAQPKLVTVEYGRHNDRIDIGCPVMKNNEINKRAMDEIAEQVERVRDLIY
jgi:uncharacterized protein